MKTRTEMTKTQVEEAVGRELGTFDEMTPDLYRNLYEDLLLTDTQIADLFGTYQQRTRRYRAKHGIETIGKTGQLTHRLPPLTSRQHSLLVGSLLGDGWMSASSRSSARFAVNHSMKQAGYLAWKIEQFGSFVASVTDVRWKTKSGRVVPGRRFTTHSCTVLRPYYDRFYPGPSRERRFPSDLHGDFDALALAIWYLDDGTLTNNWPSICFGLDPRSLKRARRALRKLGLQTEIYDYESDADAAEEDGHPTVSIVFPKQTDEFFALVGPHIPECMAYKLRRETPRIESDRNAKRLTPGLAAGLYTGGVRVSEIACLYGVGESTVGRRLRKAGVERDGKPGPSERVAVDDAAAVLRGVDHKGWRERPAGEQDAVVDEVTSVLQRCPFPFPIPAAGVDLERELASVRAKALEVDGDGVLGPWSPTGTRGCVGYFPNRYTATSANAKTSAHEAWFDEKKLRAAVRFQLKVGDPVTPNRVLRALTMQYRTPTIFRPTVARWVYEMYCGAGGVAWDPCAGYGGRLLGAHAAGVRYVGTDVEEQTVAGNESLGRTLGAAFEVHRCSAHDFDVPDGVGLVFTSPPYFNQERYSESEGQSFVRWASFQEWVEVFLRGLVTRAWEALPGGGILVLNVADVRQRTKVYPLVEETLRVCSEAGFSEDARLFMPLARVNRSAEKAREPLLIFRKL